MSTALHIAAGYGVICFAYQITRFVRNRIDDARMAEGIRRRVVATMRATMDKQPG